MDPTDSDPDPQHWIEHLCLIDLQRGAFAAEETQAVPRHSDASLPSRHIRDGEDSRRQEQ
jgi:hypothetical protein